MVTFHVELAPGANSTGKHSVRIRITSERLHKRIALGFAVFKKDFNPNGVLEKKNWIRATCTAFHEYNLRVKDTLIQLIEIVSELQKNKGGLSAVDVQTAYMELDKRGSFVAFYRASIEEKQNAIDYSSFETYKAGVEAFEKYLISKGKVKDKKVYIDFNEITPKLINDFDAYLKKEYSLNTVYYYMALLLRYVKKAHKKGLMRENPASEIIARKDEIEPEKLTDTQIEQISQLEFKKVRKDRITQSRDIFLFMYYCFGARIGDILFAKVSNVVETDGVHRFIYTTQKSNKNLNVKLPAKAIEIFKVYSKGKQKDDFLFPFINPRKDYSKKKEFYNEKHSKVSVINSNLRKIALIIGAPELHCHMARHSFSDNSRKKKANLYAVSKSLGHSSLAYTEKYLKRFDLEAVDELSDLY